MFHMLIEEKNMTEHDLDLDFFIHELANMLILGNITPRDIYDTVMEVNNNDHHLAMVIKDKAMSVAGTIRIN